MNMKRRSALMMVLGLALSGLLFGFAATPAQALSITGTYTDIAFGSAGTGGAITGFDPGLVGPIGSSLSGGFPNTTTLGNNFWSTTLGTGITPDGRGTQTTPGLALSFPSNFFAQGQANDSTFYLASHWTAAFSNSGPVTFTVAADDHAFLYVDGKLVVDDGGVKGIGDSGATQSALYTLTGNHTLDLFWADVHVVQSALMFGCDGCADPTSTVPEPATLLLFGTTLVGLGSVVRRRMKKGAA